MKARTSRCCGTRCGAFWTASCRARRRAGSTLRLPTGRICSQNSAGSASPALTVPEEYGGSGVDILAAIVAIEELARRGTSLAGPYIHCAFYGALNLLENGSEEQKCELLPRLARGEILFAYGLSEPDVGGDLASATVTGRLDADGTSVVVNGTKRWCTGARIADYIYTLVRSGPAEDRYRNLSLLLVPAQSRGHLDRRHRPHRAALRGDHRRDLRRRAGASRQHRRRAGEVEPRLADAGRSLARHRDASRSRRWRSASPRSPSMTPGNTAQERRQFGRRICGHQAIRHLLVEARTRLAACRHMLYHAPGWRRRVATAVSRVRWPSCS